MIKQNESPYWHNDGVNQTPKQETNNMINDVKKMETKLEEMMDKHTTYGVLYSIASICGEKASHVEENWQDKHLADEWLKIQKSIDKLISKIVWRQV